MTGHHDHTHPHDHDDRWKHDGVRVIPGDQLDPNVPSTAGMDRKAAINFARVGAQKLWAGTVTIKPDAKTGAHHHGHLESIIYVVKGKARMRWGEHLQFTAEASPGDFIFIPPTSRTRRSTPAATRCWNACWSAATARPSPSISTSSRWRSRKRCCGSIPCIAIQPRRSDNVIAVEQAVIPGRFQRVRAKRGPMASNPESRDSGLALMRAPE